MTMIYTLAELKKMLDRATTEEQRQAIRDSIREIEALKESTT